MANIGNTIDNISDINPIPTAGLAAAKDINKPLAVKAGGVEGRKPKIVSIT